MSSFSVALRSSYVQPGNRARDRRVNVRPRSFLSYLQLAATTCDDAGADGSMDGTYTGRTDEVGPVEVRTVRSVRPGYGK